MAKLGDSKTCGLCGGTTILRIVQPSFATLGWVDDRYFPYDTPSLPMWQCDDCHDQHPLSEDLES